MPNYLSKSEQETKSIATQLAKTASNHIIALTGELGSGKTVFAQGFATGLGIKDKVISPTFVLIRQHQIPRSSKTFYHIDLYRLKDTKDLDQVGIEEILSNQNNIVLIEWAEKYSSLPSNTIKVTIAKLSDNQRLISID